MNYFRIFSGHLKSGSTYYNAEKGQDERFGQLLVLRGKEQFPVTELHGGDIGAIAKLTYTQTGDTISSKDRPIKLRKPVYPSAVYAVALEPRNQADGTKMGAILTLLAQADPTLRWRLDPETKQTVLEGMGDIHIQVALSRGERMGCGLIAEVPRVPYREAITRTASAQYRHRKQSGGAGQFGEVHLRVEPRQSGEGFEYVNAVVGGAIAGSFIPSIEKGIRSVMEQGVLAGYVINDVRVVVYDGKMHPVDSKDIAFQIAGREAFKEAFMAATPVFDGADCGCADHCAGREHGRCIERHEYAARTGAGHGHRERTQRCDGASATHGNAALQQRSALYDGRARRLHDDVQPLREYAATYRAAHHCRPCA